MEFGSHLLPERRRIKPEGKYMFSSEEKDTDEKVYDFVYWVGAITLS